MLHSRFTTTNFCATKLLVITFSQAVVLSDSTVALPVVNRHRSLRTDGLWKPAKLVLCSVRQNILIFCYQKSEAVPPTRSSFASFIAPTIAYCEAENIMLQIIYELGCVRACSQLQSIEPSRSVPVPGRPTIPSHRREIDRIAEKSSADEGGHCIAGGRSAGGNRRRGI